MAERSRPSIYGYGVEERLSGGSPRETSQEASHTKESQKSAETILDRIGLKEFSSEQLDKARDRLRLEIALGIQHPGEPIGIPAVPSEISPITREQFHAIPDGESTLTLAMGGTNPIVVLWGKNNDELERERSWLCEPIDKETRSLPDEAFGQLAAQKVAESVPFMNLKNGKSIKSIKSVGISLGFPAAAWEDSDLGIDAQAHQSKNSNWQFTSEERTPFGEVFLQSLHEHGFTDVEFVYFLPDPLALANDEPGAKLSLQAGTGTNMSAFIDGNHWDMQISSAKDIFEEESGSELFQKMDEKGMVPFGNAIKQYTGGPRIKNRVVAAMSLLEKEQVIREGTAANIEKAITQPGMDSILSDIVNNFGINSGDNFESNIGVIRNYLKQAYQLNLDESEYTILQEVSIRALHQAGQVIGLMTAAAVQEVGYKDGHDSKGPLTIPVDGGVIDKAYGVQVKAMDTIDALLPGNNITYLNRSDARGLAKKGMSLAANLREEVGLGETTITSLPAQNDVYIYGNQVTQT